MISLCLSHSLWNMSNTNSPLTATSLTTNKRKKERKPPKKNTKESQKYGLERRCNGLRLDFRLLLSNQSTIIMIRIRSWTQVFVRKILFSHLFWLDSHFFCRSDFKQNKFECMRSSHALRGSRNHGVTKSDRQKRCENRIFHRFLLTIIMIKIQSGTQVFVDYYCDQNTKSVEHGFFFLLLLQMCEENSPLNLHSCCLEYKPKKKGQPRVPFAGQILCLFVGLCGTDDSMKFMGRFRGTGGSSCALTPAKFVRQCLVSCEVLLLCTAPKKQKQKQTKKRGGTPP